MQKLGILTILLCAVFAIESASACGLSWMEPDAYFEGTDFRGHVSRVENLATLDFGDEKIPVFAIFGSEATDRSPYLGYGWSMPLLESKIYQLDENAFRLNQPDGWFRVFWRDRKDPSILHGQGGWKGEIQGDTITVVADCGAKIVFNKGKISSLQVGGHVLTYVYEDGIISEVREGNNRVLRIDRDPRNANGLLMTLQDGKVGRLAMGDMPKVQAVGEVRVLEKLEKSLTEASFPSGNRSFSYGVDEMMNQTMAANDKIIVWDPVTRKILQQGDDKFEVIPDNPKDKDSQVKINRILPDGKKESWHAEYNKFRLTTIDSEGIKTVTQQFSSGALYGKLRSIVRENLKDGTKDVVERRVYDEKGRILRVFASDQLVSSYSYDPEKVETLFKNGSPVLIKKFSEDGTLKSVVDPADAAIEKEVQFALSLARSFEAPKKPVANE